MSVKVTIYRIPGSHPCQAVIRGAELKGIEHKLVDLLPPLNILMMRAKFGARTVPAMRIEDKNGVQKVQTTIKCLHALEAIQPEPAIYPADAAQRRRVLEAERWGVDELQDPTRRILWVALKNRPAALPSFTRGAKLPVPNGVVGLLAKPTIIGARRLSHATAKRVRADLEELPQLIDHIDALVESQTIAQPQTNAGDLSILSSIWLLRALDDVRPMLDSRPAGRRARELFGEPPGAVPEGAFPAAWLTAVNAARGDLG